MPLSTATSPPAYGDTTPNRPATPSENPFVTPQGATGPASSPKSPYDDLLAPSAVPAKSPYDDVLGPSPAPATGQPRPHRATVGELGAPPGYGEHLYATDPGAIIEGVRAAEGVPSYGQENLAAKYGGSHTKVPESEGRAGAAATLHNDFKAWVQAGKPGDFLDYFADHYAPMGASNDPSNLNANWTQNLVGAIQRGSAPHPSRLVPNRSTGPDFFNLADPTYRYMTPAPLGQPGEYVIPAGMSGPDQNSAMRFVTQGHITQSELSALPPSTQVWLRGQGVRVIAPPAVIRPQTPAERAQPAGAPSASGYSMRAQIPTELAGPQGVPGEAPLSAAAHAVASRYLSPGTQQAVGIRPTPYQPPAMAQGTDVLSAAARGFSRGAMSPISGPTTTPLLMKPPAETGLAGEVENVTDVVGQFLPVSLAFKTLDGVRLAAKLTPVVGRILQAGGAGALYRAVDIAVNNRDELARRSPLDGAVWLGQQLGLSAVQWGAFQGGLEGLAGLVRAGGPVLNMLRGVEERAQLTPEERAAAHQEALNSLNPQARQAAEAVTAPRPAPIAPPTEPLARAIGTPPVVPETLFRPLTSLSPEAAAPTVTPSAETPIEPSDVQAAAERIRTSLRNAARPVPEPIPIGETVPESTSVAPSVRTSEEISSTIDPSQRSIVESAYGEGVANLERLSRSPNANDRAVARSLVTTAPRLAALNDAVRRNIAYPISLGPDIASATGKLADLRASGTPINAYFARQPLFGNQELTPTASKLLRLFDQAGANGQQVRDILTTYADRVEALGDPNQTGLFGEMDVPPSKDEMLQNAIDTVLTRTQMALANERGGIDLDAFTKIGEDVRVHLRQRDLGLKAARAIEHDADLLEARRDADRVWAVRTKTTTPATPSDLEQLYHHDENPSEPLTPQQQVIWDHIVQPIATDDARLFQKVTGKGVPIPQDLYTPRQPIGKGGMVDRLMTGLKSLGGGRLSTGKQWLTTTRTMMRITDEEGHSRVAAIKRTTPGAGKDVLVFGPDKKPAGTLGTLKLKTLEELRDKQIDPINKGIDVLSRRVRALTSVSLRTAGKVESLEKELFDLTSGIEDAASGIGITQTSVQTVDQPIREILDELQSKDLGPIQQRIAVLTDKVKALSQIRSTAPDRVQTLETDIDRLSSGLQEAASSDPSLTGRIRAQRASIRNDFQRLREARTNAKEFTRVGSRIGSLTQRINDLQSISQDIRQRYATGELSIVPRLEEVPGTSLGQRIRAQRTQITNTLRQLRTLRGPAWDQARLTGRIETLAQRIDDLKSHAAYIESQYNPEELNRRVFIAKDGKQYTIGQATTKEIEAQTGQRYHKDVLANRLAHWVRIRDLARTMDFFDSIEKRPDFKKIAVKIGPGVQIPPGFRTVNVPKYRYTYAFDGKVAAVLDKVWGNLHDQASAGTLDGFLGAFRGVNRFLRNAILYNALKHIPNVAMQAFVNRGITGLSPTTWPRAWKAGIRAVTAVTQMNDDYIQAMEAGASLRWASELYGNLPQALVQRASDDIDRLPGVRQRLARAFGFENPAQMLNPHKVSGHATWWTNDVLVLQALYERMDAKGETLQQAARQIHKTIPSYRTPAMMLGSERLAKLVTNPNVFIFSPYHVNLMSSFGSMAKDLVAPLNPGDRWDALNKLLALGLVTNVAYPYLLDPIARQVSGNPRARAQRVGMAALVDAAAQGYGQALNRPSPGGVAAALYGTLARTLTPTPLVRAGMEGAGVVKGGVYPSDVEQPIIGGIDQAVQNPRGAAETVARGIGSLDRSCPTRGTGASGEQAPPGGAPLPTRGQRARTRRNRSRHSTRSCTSSSKSPTRHSSWRPRETRKGRSTS